MAYSAGDVPSVQLYSGVESQMAPNRAWETAGSALDWYKDDLIAYDLAGSGAHPTVTTVASSAADINGIAMADSTGTAGIAFDVALLDITAIYKMYMDSTSPPAPTLIGKAWDLVYTKGVQRVTDAAHGNEEVIVVGIPENYYNVNESPVYVRFSYKVFTGIA